MRSARRFLQRLGWGISVCLCTMFSLALLSFSFGSPRSLRNQQAPTQPVLPSYSIECEDLIASAKTGQSFIPGASYGEVTRQEMAGFGQGWSGNAQLFWGGQKPSNFPKKFRPQLRLSFEPPKPGTYVVVLHFTTAPDFGLFDVFLDGHKSGSPFNGYATKVAPKAQSLGEYQLAAGTHQLALEVYGLPAGSKGYAVGLDRIELKPVAVSPIKRSNDPQKVGKPSV